MFVSNASHFLQRSNYFFRKAPVCHISLQDWVFQWQQVVGTPAFMRSQIYKNEFATDICICWKVSQVKTNLKVYFLCGKKIIVINPLHHSVPHFQLRSALAPFLCLLLFLPWCLFRSKTPLHSNCHYYLRTGCKY